MEVTGIVLLSLLAVVISGLVARGTRLPLPLVQVALGAGMAVLGPGPVTLEPELFFLLFLPPLLFLDGWRIPKDALRRDAGTILKLALGLVLFTVLGLGLFIHWLLPSVPLAVAFALAAAISPTDPVTVSSIAARSAVPPRLMHVLQGEALLNDASGLVCMRYAVAAALTGTFSWSQALGSFVWLAAVGLAVGVGVTWCLAHAAAWAWGRWKEEPSVQILGTLVLPFGVYMLAEQLQGSGILAAVAAGVTMGLNRRWPWRASTRLHRTAVWDLVQFAANGSIFVLLGEQLPALLQGAGATAQHAGYSSAWWLARDAVALALVLALLRFAWVWVSLNVRFVRARQRGEAALPADNRMVLVVSLAGARGAVSMAAVLTLPLVTASGAPFPSRDVVVLLAAGVIVLSLLLATLALPPALAGLRVASAAPGAAAAAAQLGAEDGARLSAAHCAVAAVHAAAAALAAASAQPLARAQAQAAAQRIAALYEQRMSTLAPGQGGPKRSAAEAIERKLRLAGLRAERAELLRYGRAQGVSELTLRRWVREIDLQETRQGG